MWRLAGGALRLSLLALLVAPAWSSSSGAAAGKGGGSGSAVSVPYKPETHRAPVRALHEEESLAVCARYTGELAEACEHGVKAAARASCEPAAEEGLREGAKVVTDAKESEEEGERGEFTEAGRGEEFEEGAAAEGEGEEGEELEFTETDTAISLMLLGAIGFTMALFSMANHPDKDMRFYCWSVINRTISIFVAVLLYEGCNGALESFMDELGFSEGIKLTVFFSEMLGFYLAAHVATASASGILTDQAPFAEGRQGRNAFGQWATLPMAEQRKMLDRRVKCWATLISHMTAFAAIRAGMHLLEADFFREHPIATYLVSGFMLLINLALGVAFRKIRKSIFIKHTTRTGYVPLPHLPEEVQDHQLSNGIHGRTFVLTQWDEELYEAENEVVGLCVSFLLVEACKFNINHVYEAMEPEQVVAGGSWKLLFFAVLFALGTGVSVLTYSSIPKDEHHGGAGRGVVEGKDSSQLRSVFLRRMTLISQNAMAMAVSWTMLTFAKWVILTNLAVLGGAEKSAFRVFLALVVSFSVFFVTTLLDYLADLECTGESADLVIFTLIQAMGMAVGFSWEQAFHLGVEVVAVQAGKPVVGQVILGLIVSAVCIVPWRRHILSKTIDLSKERLKEYGGKETAVKQMEEQTKEDNLADA